MPCNVGLLEGGSFCNIPGCLFGRLGGRKIGEFFGTADGSSNVELVGLKVNCLDNEGVLLLVFIGIVDGRDVVLVIGMCSNVLVGFIFCIVDGSRE